jgi:hypothetical protein
LSEIAAHCAKPEINSQLERHQPVIPEARWITD